MKIVSLHITSFGKLQNVQIDFNGQLNVLQQNNGYGKTTVASFVRAMLYGFKYTRTKRGNESVSDVGVWTTWNSREKIGGSLVVRHNGELFRIERYFGLTAKQESLSVVKVESGLPVAMASPGEYFLGLTADSFDRSAYLPQEAVEMCSNENFDTRLAGLVQNTENYNKVQESLRKYKKDLKFERGSGGVIYEKETQRFVLQRSLNQRIEAEQRQGEIDARLQEIAQQRVQINKQTEKCNGEIFALQQDIVKLQSPQNSEERARLQQLQEKVLRCGNLEKDFASCKTLADKIDSMPDAARVQRQISFPMLICGILAILAGAGVCFLQLIVGLCVAFSGAVCAVLAFFVKPSVKTLQAGEKDALISQYFTIASEYVYCAGLSYNQVKQQFWQRYNEYVGDKRLLETLSKNTNASENALQQQEKLLRLAQEKLQNLQIRLQEMSKEEGLLIAERGKLDTDALSVREQLVQVEKELAQVKQQYAVATKVSELLERARENLSTSYLPKLCQRCEELLNQITECKFQIVLDRNFSISLRENGVTKALDNFSRGVREITLLCFRVALSEMLFDGQIPFVLIDDAFVNFDEENFLRATKLLKQLSLHTQVVYFTCHKRLGELH